LKICLFFNLARRFDESFQEIRGGVEIGGAAYLGLK